MAKFMVLVAVATGYYISKVYMTSPPPVRRYHSNQTIKWLVFCHPVLIQCSRKKKEKSPLDPTVIKGHFD